MRDVPWLKESRIEAEAELLLSAYASRFGQVAFPPVPVEAILEKHLGLSLNFDDLPMKLGFEDVIGALFVREKEVFIDQSLDPHENPTMLGRFRFTVGHEIGHWCLHRPLLLENENQLLLIEEDAARLRVICRTSEAQMSVEYQANHFASCLLMPKNLLFMMWKGIYPDRDAVSLNDLETNRSEILARESILRGGLNYGLQNTNDVLFENVARPFAKQFEVSTQAMRIRLEKLNLLTRVSSQESILSSK